MSERPERKHTLRSTNAERCAEAIVERVGKRIVLGLPLGLGKGNLLANALYQYVKARPDLSLHIVTALTLETPSADNLLAQRFLEPVVKNQYGDYPGLDFARDRQQGRLPENIHVSEFFLKPGAFIRDARAQQDYVCSNYSHVVRDLLDAGINVIAQMVAPHENNASLFSLSCNPDITLDLLAALTPAQRQQFVLAGEINSALPFMPHDAVLDEEQFDLLLESEPYSLFPIPLMPIDYAHYAMATHVASLVKDGGTLQIGIGSLGDAITHMLVLRQQFNTVYQALLSALLHEPQKSLRSILPVQREVFVEGLYGASEMAVEGFLHLRESGVLRRKVYDDKTLQRLLNEKKIVQPVTLDALDALREAQRVHEPLHEADWQFLRRYGLVADNVRFVDGQLHFSDGSALPATLADPATRQKLEQEGLGESLCGGIYLHGGFFLGSARFYQQLRELPEQERDGINMTGISFINELFGDTELKQLQRRDACFVNSAMMATLNGAVISDGLGDGIVVSGVGGQYNFVAQAHVLEGARSILCLPSTRRQHGEIHSNIVWQYPHQTIPRHLRDIVVTEYGAAVLRGKTDRDVIVAMLAITDSQFQQELLAQAKAAGKVEQDYQIPSAFRNNTAAALKQKFADAGAHEHLPYYPLGTAFSDEEALLAAALHYLKERRGNKRKLLDLLWQGLRGGRKLRNRFYNHLARMQLLQTNGWGERINRWVLLGALANARDLRRPLRPKSQPAPMTSERSGT
ncbi:acetyl-CoA hydrolase/transferase C-terminal domain-containing protein [Permianibacter aggregans]|uniref:Acetyl-CoA hydrolase/transferase-like protein n=1 Tax=Permianibacter aggregans TaxID=1510150 RepID=A0A4R6UG11_9GAMM|nr:acetyl-CoA hydrolase/transferase C-terminal domain-containing protein [Permianibacter aggregans]QGX41635.1 acetyl-CoA hydrolase [Permianibacter aggregans]TDQ45708.1 acetyl-CoA hydrolase/transferase-like protein [Permianibacter aggregans]